MAVQWFKTNNLVKMENTAQQVLAPIRFAPSIYYKLRKPVKQCIIIEVGGAIV